MNPKNAFTMHIHYTYNRTFYLFIYLFIYICSMTLCVMCKTQIELFLKRRLSVFPQSIHWLIFGP
jgi:hypothetical protein